MKKQLKVILIVMLAAVVAAAVIMLYMAATGKGSLLTPVGTRAEFSSDTKGYPSALTVNGSKFVNDDGEQVVLRGVMTEEPYEQYTDGDFNEKFYRGIFDVGGNAIRVPVSPKEYSRDDYYLWRYLDRIVTWAGENDHYVIIDWDYTGNPVDGSGDEMPDMDENPLDYSAQFWSEVASYFKDAPNVIYEIYNEPVGMSDTEWKRCADSLIGVIRDAGADQLIIVGSPDYCYDLAWIDELGMSDDNIGFSIHVYSDRTRWKSNLSEYMTGYPVMVTEWAATADELTDETHVAGFGSSDGFAAEFSGYMQEQSVSWIANGYTDSGEYAICKSGFDGMTEWGSYVKSLLSDDN